MTTRRTLTLAWRVILQLATDRRTIALILFVPLFVLTIAGVLVRADTSQISIGVVMQDQGSAMPFGTGNVNLGERLTEALGQVSANVHVQTLDAAEAQAQLEQGQLDAIITLGADFSKQTIANKALNLSVEYEGSNPMAARLLEGLVTRSAIQTLAGLSVIAVQSIPSVHLDATYLFGSASFDSLDYLAPAFIGLFVFFFVFMLTSVAFLRERAAGTLERLQATPIRRVEIVIGYMLGFSLFALIQSLIILAFTIFGLGVHYIGSLLVVFLVEILLALMAVNLGIFASTYARNEFQVVQFIPLVIVTQILLSGAIWAIKDMPSWLQPIAWLMPLTHANRALRDVMIKGYDLVQVGPYVLILTLFAIGFVLLAARSVQRQVQG